MKQTNPRRMIRRTVSEKLAMRDMIIAVRSLSYS
jgi:hypothetical protein